MYELGHGLINPRRVLQLRTTFLVRISYGKRNQGIDVPLMYKKKGLLR